MSIIFRAVKRYSHITFFYSSFCPALSWRRVFQYYPTFVCSCRVYFSTEARSCGVFYPPPVQADMLSACMEYEDILSDKQQPNTYSCLRARLRRRVLRIKNPDIRLRRITYPPEQKEPGIRADLFWPFFLHFVLKASKLERRPYLPQPSTLPSLGVIDEVASLVE